MSNRSTDDVPWASMVKIPADVDREDTVLGPLSARQTVQLAAVLLVLWLGYRATRQIVPPLFFAALALPIATTATLAVLTRRDGLSTDRWLLAAWRHQHSPKHLVPAGGLADVLPWQAEILDDQPVREPSGTLALPISDIDEHGVLDLGPAGFAAIGEAGTVNLALRTGAEQQALLAAFGRWLNALAGPAQILLRTRRLEIGSRVAALEQVAPSMPHPLLEAACLAHADFLGELAERHELLQRQVLIVHREPGSDSGSWTRALRHRDETIGLLAAAEVPVLPLDGTAAFAALSAACEPDAPSHPRPALPRVPVTAETTVGEPW
ncbi:PrgI family protein [Streptomyces tateyamensis]|uniref:PrgI family protein n=1 Tax=Streptomyces tateyamensis TaxID=565073 RepID=A0A2V4NJ12_9ACTN|nr:PrgI family protein [Streptomyces tateyamensis]PYC68365.1 PrgI family protein [Streptomyces tateyamensis]